MSDENSADFGSRLIAALEEAVAHDYGALSSVRVDRVEIVTRDEAGSGEE